MAGDGKAHAASALARDGGGRSPSSSGGRADSRMRNGRRFRRRPLPTPFSRPRARRRPRPAPRSRCGHGLRLGLFQLVAHQPPQDLADGALRQRLVAEDDVLRHLVAGQVLPAVGDDAGPRSARDPSGRRRPSRRGRSARPARRSPRPRARPDALITTSSTSFGYTLKPDTMIMSFLRSVSLT